MSKQSKKGSIAESTTNLVIGTTIGFTMNILILPLFGYNVTVVDSLGISLVYTTISFIRSYTVRRIYNKYNFFHKGDKDDQ